MSWMLPTWLLRPSTTRSLPLPPPQHVLPRLHRPMLAPPGNIALSLTPLTTHARDTTAARSIARIVAWQSGQKPYFRRKAMISRVAASLRSRVPPQHFVPNGMPFVFRYEFPRIGREHFAVVFDPDPALRVVLGLGIVLRFCAQFLPGVMS